MEAVEYQRFTGLMGMKSRVDTECGPLASCFQYAGSPSLWNCEGTPPGKELIKHSRNEIEGKDGTENKCWKCIGKMANMISNNFIAILLI